MLVVNLHVFLESVLESANLAVHEDTGYAKAKDEAPCVLEDVPVLGSHKSTIVECQSFNPLAEKSYSFEGLWL